MAVVDVKADMQSDQPVLDVRDLKVTFQTPRGHVHAVNGVSFHVEKGEALGILGESGSGKSVSVGAIMGLLESPPARIEGQVNYRDTELISAPASVTRSIHGDRIAMIYQDAITSLNPSLTIGNQIGELFKVHRPNMGRREIQAKSIELLEAVGIQPARERVNSYPHEFSGGMNQRIMIALGIALSPEILIADEPTTALDVTVQAQIMRLLGDLRGQIDMALILITHDIGLVAENTDRLMVMYGGGPVETGPTDAIIERPAHPYTIGLLNSIPHDDMKGKKLIAISGSPPKLNEMPKGCVFAPRCAMAKDMCRKEIPVMTRIAPDHSSACHFAQEVVDG
ncbi:ABC transporter ATP-binding protein [Rhodobacteraceae bacterium]|nr:ABC transporter ATP-binding protein [Paracoccaceae bacterium]